MSVPVKLVETLSVICLRHAGNSHSRNSFWSKPGRGNPAITTLLTTLWLVAVALAGPIAVAAEPPAAPQRIVSLAPTTTEILFTLGMGDRLVGVTRYCDTPPEALNVANVGGFVDPNYEAIVSLQPDLVVLLSSHRDSIAALDKLGLNTLVTPHNTIDDVLVAIQQIGEACQASASAEALVQNLTQRTDDVRQAVAGQPRPRVLLCIGRDTTAGQLVGMYIAGHDGYYNEIIEIAGGVNAYPDRGVAFPQVSAEGVITINPDVIVDLVSHITPDGPDQATIQQQWNQLTSVSAVRHQRVHVIVGNQALRPGPRYINFLEAMTKLLHPDTPIPEKVDD